MRKLEQALGSGTAVACIALVIGACAAAPFDEVMEEVPPCEDSWSALLDDVNLDQSPEYVGDYADGVLIASTGTPCGEASHPERCATALQAAEQTSPGRVLITTEGDEVHAWGPEALPVLLGTIDTPSEAIYMALSFGYWLNCDETVTRVAEGYRISVSGSAPSPCRGGGGTIPASGEIVVHSAGQVDDFAPGGLSRSGCGSAGAGGFPGGGI